MSQLSRDPLGEETTPEAAMPRPADNGKPKSPDLTEVQKAVVERYGQHSPQALVRCAEVPGESRAVTVDENDGFCPLQMSETLATANLQGPVYLLSQAIASLRKAMLPSARNDCLGLEAAQVVAPLLAGIRPQNEGKSMLAVQMMAVHDRMMDEMRLATVPDQTQEMRQFHSSCAAKLLWTFLAQAETLKKCRTGGPPTMPVEPASVNEDSQAMGGCTRTQGGDAPRGTSDESRPKREPARTAT